MSSEAERFRELDRLIRTAHAQLGTLQLHLIAAHERQVNPADLGIHIAELGRQLSAWKHERRFLCRHVAERSMPVVEAPIPANLAPETPKRRRLSRGRRVASGKKAPAA